MNSEKKDIIAVCVNGTNYTTKAFAIVTKNINKMRQVEVVPNVSGIIPLLQENRLKAIINIVWKKSQGKLENIIKHDMRSAEYERITLPTIIDKPWHEIEDIVNTIKGLIQETKTSINQINTNSISNNLHNNLNPKYSLYIPTQRKRVAILDDIPCMIQEIMSLLHTWPNIEATFIKVTSELDINLTQLIQNDIILLDENMGQSSGTDIFKTLEEVQYKGYVASTTSGNRPDWSRKINTLCFKNKDRMDSDNDEKNNFVDFMNSILKEVDSKDEE